MHTPSVPHSFNPSRPLRMLHSGPLKHRWIAFTHTSKHRLCWIAARASSPPNPQPPSALQKHFHSHFNQTRLPLYSTRKKKKGLPLELQHLFQPRPTSAERSPALNVARPGEASRSEPQQQRASTAHSCQTLSPCRGESSAAVTSPDGEGQNGVSLPLAGPAEVMGRGLGWAHRPHRGKQSRQQARSWKQTQTQNMQCRLGNNGADWKSRGDDGGLRGTWIRGYSALYSIQKTQSGFQLIPQHQPRSSTLLAHMHLWNLWTHMHLWNLWIHGRKAPQRNQPTFFQSLGCRYASNKWLLLNWLIISLGAPSTALPR